MIGVWLIADELISDLRTVVVPSFTLKLETELHEGRLEIKIELVSVVVDCVEISAFTYRGSDNIFGEFG